MGSSRRPRRCARLETAPSSPWPPTRPSSTRSGPSTNSTQPARASHFEQRGRRPACTGVPRRRPCRRGIGARGRRHPPPPASAAPRRAAPRAMLTSALWRPPSLGGWSSCSGRASCAPDGNYLCTLAGHSRRAWRSSASTTRATRPAPPARPRRTGPAASSLWLPPAFSARSRLAAAGQGDEEFTAAAFNPSGETVVVGGSFNRFRTFSLNAHENSWQPTGVKEVENMCTVTCLSWKQARDERPPPPPGRAATAAPWPQQQRRALFVYITSCGTCPGCGIISKRVF